jgi:acetyl esterase/lipase
MEGTQHGLYHIALQNEHMKDFKRIVGFTLTVRLVTPGSLGGGRLAINALMAARGKLSSEAFSMDYAGSIPNFTGDAQEIVTFSDSFLAGMVFKNPVAVDFSVSHILQYNGTKALFKVKDDVITLCSIYGLFEINGVSWIYGDPAEDVDSSDEGFIPVKTRLYENIKTVENGSEFNYVDIRVPEGNGSYPVILWIHGGAWSMLNRKSCFITTTMDYLLFKGYAVVSAEYTLSVAVENGMKGGYPCCINDLKAAVRFIRANGGKYNLDTRFIAAMGESAGGHLAMLLGTTNGSRLHEDLSTGNADCSSDVQAMISYFGPSDISGVMAYAALGSESMNDAEMSISASPCYQINKNSPPLFLTHGENDTTVPISHSNIMKEKALELIGEENVTSVFYKDAPHASKSAFDTKSAREAVEQFLTKHLNNLISEY